MATDPEQNNDYVDLINFLGSNRSDLRLEASKAVLSVVTDRYEIFN